MRTWQYFAKFCKYFGNIFPVCIVDWLALWGGMLKIWFSAGVGHITQCGHWRVNVNIISDLISQPCPLLRQTAPCPAQRAADNINLLKEIEKERELSLERTGEPNWNCEETHLWLAGPGDSDVTRSPDRPPGQQAESNESLANYNKCN